MSLHKAKPTSAGRRFVVQVKTGGLHKGKPYGPLLDKKSSKGGRNHNGRITVRHQGGGHKQRYRIIDFKRDKDGVPGIVERLESRSSAARTRRSSRAMPCRCAPSRSERRSTTWK
jgi:large subunit ribosomal protein L2